MKKLLISILILLLVILAYFTMFKGMSLGSLQILGISQIVDLNDSLTNTIQKTNSLLKKEYPSKQEELSDSVTELLEKKEEYFKMAKVSTEGEINKANTEETYLIEYLWARVGGHATSNSVVLEFNVKASSDDQNMYDLAFIAKGQYTKIIKFISALENDDKLNFKIENFKMVKDNTNLVATFNVKNIRIKKESISSAVTQQKGTATNTQSNDDSTNTNSQS